MLRQALGDPDERVRESAVYALCDYRERAAYHLLTEIVSGETDTVKKAAAWGLRNCSDSAAVPVLEAALTASDPDVRINVLEALSANNTPDALRVVRTMLDDPASEVVYNAVLSLIEMEEDACIVEISRLIDKVDGARLEPILRGLFHATNYLHLPLAEHPAVHVLLDALAHAVIDPAPEARQAVAWVLAWMRHDDATNLLRYLYYEEQDSIVKAHILRVTRALMNDAGDELLADAIFSDDPILVQAAQPFERTFAHFDQHAVAAAPLVRDELAWR
jgi:HEAT repeat protein